MAGDLEISGVWPEKGLMKKLSHADRQRSIVRAAAAVFAEKGVDGAKTKAIAAAAGVSPALLYEHFPSKKAMYRAVLRQLMRDQDTMTASMSKPFLVDGRPGTDVMLEMLDQYYSACVFSKKLAIDVNLSRLLLASLASDGILARLLYRRILRRNGDTLGRALDDARRRGDMLGQPISVRSAFCFIEHIGTMLLSSHWGDVCIAPYGEREERLVRQAVLFCGRGLGFTNEALQRYHPESVELATTLPL